MYSRDFRLRNLGWPQLGLGASGLQHVSNPRQEWLLFPPTSVSSIARGGSCVPPIAFNALNLFITQDIIHASGTGPQPLCDELTRVSLLEEGNNDSDVLWNQHQNAVPPRLPRQRDTFNLSVVDAGIASAAPRAARRVEREAERLNRENARILRQPALPAVPARGRGRGRGRGGGL